MSDEGKLAWHTEDNELDCTSTLKGANLLKSFVSQYISGAQGASMDCDTAQHLAEAIQANVNRDELFEEAVKALEPFAAAADGYDPDEGDGAQVAWAHDFTIASLCHARDILARIRGA